MESPCEFELTKGTSFHTFLLVKKAHVMMEFTRWGDW